MKVFSVYGYTQTGKTTTIECIIRELKKRRYSVGSVKEIHFEEFKIDQKGTNTFRHREAGSQLVTARGLFETDILYPTKLSIPEILTHYDHDYVICEGATDYNMPRILTGATIEDLEKRWSKGVFAISGKIADSMDEYRGVPVINALDQCEKLVDLIEEKVFNLLPDVDEACCTACGTNCRDFCEGVLRGKYKVEDCVQNNKEVEVYVNGKPLDMVPFVQNIIQHTMRGLLSQLEGYKENSTIHIEIRGD
jgi:molybdopterin-guanine dinucleotide biosynthesis protein B